MPYYLHPAGEKAEPQEHARVAYTLKPDAVADLRHAEAITFVPNDAEINAWRDREYARLHGDANGQKRYQPLPFSTPWVHYAHRAEGHPEKIAYTPDDTFGHEDRRLVTTPVRYLEKYADLISYSREQFAELAAKMRAGKLPLSIALTEDEIARVYCAPDGPSSCMDGRDFNLDNTPVRAYAGGDLAVAYIGTLGTTPDKDRVYARAVVWQAKKTYVRAYGDIDAIVQLLESEGYQRINSWHGAKLRAIEYDNKHWVVPYIDGNTQRLGYDGSYYLTIGAGNICGTNTSGYADRDDMRMCAHCDGPCDDDEQYCESCLDDSYTCAGCDEVEIGNCRILNGETYCPSCYRNQRANCQHCNSRFDTIGADSDEYCPSCWDEVTICDRCNRQAHTDDLDLRDHGDHDYGVCVDCRRELSQPRRRRPAIVTHLGDRGALDLLLAWTGRAR